MSTPLSLRIARLLLVATAAFVLGLVGYIAALSGDPRGAAPWLLLLLLNAAGFAAAAVLLDRDPRKAKLLAVGTAISMAALGAVTGFGAGMLSFPAAGFGALAAWATLLSPPRRPVVLLFIAYLIAGVVTAGPTLFYPVLLPTVLIWPVRLLLFAGLGIVPIYAFLGIAASVVVLAFMDPHVIVIPRPRPLVWALAFGVAVVAGVVAVILLQAVAQLRTDTSSRFELDPLVLAVVFLGGASVAAGILTLRIFPNAASAFALGLGAAALFMTFTYRPAVTCQPNGTSQGLPLAWALSAPFGQSGTSSSGSSGTSGTGGGIGASSTGTFRSGGREAVFRCEGDRLVEYREVAR